MKNIEPDKVAKVQKGPGTSHVPLGLQTEQEGDGECHPPSTTKGTLAALKAIFSAMPPVDLSECENPLSGPRVGI